MKSIIELKLLSDTIPGSGASIKGVVDNDIVYDDFGIPFIPAKRLYGLFRESAEEISKYLNNKISEEDIIQLFGKQGNYKESDLYITSAYLEDSSSIREALKEIKEKEYSNYFSLENILDSFSYIRTQTSMDENGVALENSLRSSRVLRKGLLFYFELSFPDDKLEQIELIIKNIKKIGYQRTRGFGNVFLSIKSNINEVNEKPNNSTSFNEEDIVNINFDLINLDPIYISSDLNSPISYINGRSILGYFANQFIRKNKLDEAHKNEVFRNLFLNNETIFSNAYPKIDSKRTIPIPLSIKKIKNSTQIVDILNSNIKEQISNPGYEFVSLEKDLIKGYNIEKEVMYHHKRPEDKSIGHVTVKAKYDANEGAFYQFEVIKSEQVFSASIIGKWKFLKELGIFDEQTIRLGRSKKSQYGRVIINNLKFKKCEDEFFIWENNSTIKCLLVSDYTSLIKQNSLKDSIIDDIKNYMGVDNIDVKNIIIKQNKKSGYNNVWKLPQRQLMCLAAGSEIILINNSGEDITVNKKTFIGDLRREGFGEIIFENISNIPDYIESGKNNNIKGKGKIPLEILNYILKINIKTKISQYVLNIKLGSATKASKTFISHLYVEYKLANDSNSINNLVSNFTTNNQRDNFDHINEILFVERQNGVYKLNLNEFANFLKNNNLLLNIPDYVEEEENLISNNVFDFYKYYSMKLLTLIKYKQRN